MYSKIDIYIQMRIMNTINTLADMGYKILYLEHSSTVCLFHLPHTAIILLFRVFFFHRDVDQSQIETTPYFKRKLSTLLL